ncbi:MAG: DeoR/GlpR family DNA-binding transcription regulator [Anaerolineaceae bacterium]
MLKGERINKIMMMLKEHGSVNVHDLSKHFGVTEMTIRRDLEEIQDGDFISRIYGGAVYKTSDLRNNEMPTLNRMELMRDEKVRIAKKAAELIQPEETVFLGSGTTTFYVAQELKNRNDITIVTNSLIIINELATGCDANLIVVGGFLRRSEFSMIGHYANDMIKDLHVDKLISGAKGIHARFGLTSNHPYELVTDQALLGISEKIIIVADHTKIGYVAASRTAHIEPPLTIITTKDAAPKMIESIRNKKVEIILV